MKVLFDRRDPASVLWPKRVTFEALLDVLNATDLSGVWGEDETIGWVYQFFNSGVERKKMREESQAPRNSRELAVRNQFFTPRYVVEFLVDNTLGRTWLEMHGDGSGLAERCRYFVRSEERTRARPRKDPRDLRVLDPACGSGHFLLYCFDLLLTIYEEAWAAEPPGARSHVTGRTLRDDYPDVANLRRATPALILEHNLHGVDIDPRAAQIAALALWLRAQRAWKDVRVPATERPPVRRTHVVVAEPMPGDTALVAEFAARLDPPLLRDLFRKMVSEMRLAGELGTLILVEEGIAAELRRAREQFVKQRQTTGFLPGLEPVRKQGELDISGIIDDSFFREAEASIVEALRHFAETAAGGALVRRRLFAGDMTQGIALIDLLRTRFDVVLMNPPFGAASLAAKQEFEKAYPRTKNDIYAAFVERGILLLHPHGLLGAITSRTGFFLSSSQAWREEILLREAPPVAFADLGSGVMDAAMVEAAAYCLEKDRNVTGLKTVFLRVLESEDKAPALLAMTQGTAPSHLNHRFEVGPASFARIPGSPFPYWVAPAVLDLFVEGQRFECLPRVVRTTNNMGDNFRFVRCSYEVSGSGAWRAWAKGRAQKFYADLDLVIAWDAKKNTYRGFIGTEHRPMERPASVDLFDRPGITWPLRARQFCPTALAAGSVFSVRSFMLTSDRTDLLTLLALASSRIVDHLCKVLLGRFDYPEFIVTVVQQVPFPSTISADDAQRLAQLARRAWSVKRSLDTRCETSHAFTLPALLQVDGVALAERTAKWTEREALVDSELKVIQEEINERCFALYGIGETDRCAITEGFGANASEVASSGDAGDVEEDAGESGEGADSTADAAGLAAELAAWAVGVAFGRFDLRLCNGVRPQPAEPDPFDPLPAWSPGMLTDRTGRPLARPPQDYPSEFPESGVLVDDLGHPGDLTTAVRVVFDVVFGTGAERWWSDVAVLLDPKSHDLRVWFAGSFFEHHLKRYTKSPRKAPIVWQLGTPSGRYSVWLYGHRLTPDSIFQIQNEVVGPKLAHEERKFATLVQSAGPSPSARERKEIASQEAFIDELRTMLDEVKRVAPLWTPSLDDGVVLAMAPLWRLVPQHKPWQKELKVKWDELAAGKYDWAHLAMHLWPERVVPKCATDRSLAIAHGLEDVFWVDGTDGKWQQRPVPTRSVDELARERTSQSVKAALKSLLDAPVVASTGRGRGRRSGTAAAAGGNA